MENLNLLLEGFAATLTFQNLLAALIGAIAGLFIGAMPGIGALTGVSVLLPLTFKMNPTTAIIMLAALYYATMYGSAYSAILINIPGDTPAIMTALDGYQLTRKGKAGKALSASIYASFIGGSIGTIILTLMGPLLAKAGLAFGSPELALIILLAMTSIGWLMGDDIVSGLLATGIGMAFSTIGTDQAAGLLRFHFGLPNLMAGVSFVPLVIGMFGFSQVLELLSEPERDPKDQVKLSMKDLYLSKQEIKELTPVSIRHGFLGTFVGVLPEAGGTTAAFLSYILEKRFNKRGKEFGKGSMIGLAAPESANNAAASGAFAPLLTLGIPGSGTTALLLGGLMMWGLQPGPLLFTERPDFVWPLIASFYIGNLICLVISFASVPLLKKAISVPNYIMIPVIFSICVVASYTTNNSMFDVYFMIVVGIFSHLLKHAKIPTAPLLLAFVLSPMLEKYTRQSFDMSRGDPSIFFRNTICKVLIVAIITLSVSPLIAKRIRARKGQEPVLVESEDEQDAIGRGD